MRFTCTQNIWDLQFLQFKSFKSPRDSSRFLTCSTVTVEEAFTLCVFIWARVTTNESRRTSLWGGFQQSHGGLPACAYLKGHGGRCSLSHSVGVRTPTASIFTCWISRDQLSVLSTCDRSMSPKLAVSQRMFYSEIYCNNIICLVLLYIYFLCSGLLGWIHCNFHNFTD